MSRKGLDISLVKHRDEEKLKQKKEGVIKQYRNWILPVIFSFSFGAGTAGVLVNVEVPIDGPESPKIHLIHKLKYEIFDLFRGSAEEKDGKPEEKDDTKTDEEDSKIHIKSKPQKELDCGERSEDCLIS